MTDIRAQDETALASVKAIYEAADQANTLLGQMEDAADAAGTTLTQIYQDAEDAAAAAANAGEYAARALGNLSTVQNVAETLAWITEHGTMTLTSDVSPDPAHVYWVLDDQNGEYHVGNHYYSVVTDPKADDMATYHELSIDESLNNYVATHLAVDDEGLWLIPESASGNRVLIATGGGTTYTSAGTYIIGTNGVIIAQFGANGVVIGQLETGKTRSELSASGMQVIQKGSGAIDVPIANLGYGEGLNASGGLSNAPYYTLGIRKANSGIGNYSTAEGYNTEASGYVSHAEGRETTSSGYGSHAEGYLNDASGRFAHAEGGNGEASGDYGSHSEGAQCVAGGDYGSHAEGFRTNASGEYGSHAQGWGTKASSQSQTALGRFNVEDATGTYAEIVGNGISDSNRKNISALEWSGDLRLKGDVYVGCNDDSTGGTMLTSGGGVTGVKGNAEGSYRTGNVNLTPANIGAVPTSRTVNSKALSSDIALAPSDLGEADYVIEQNTANGWLYRKWNSGLAECWKTVTITDKTNSSDAGGYVSASAADPGNFPFTFASVPNVQVTVSSGGITGSVTSVTRPTTQAAGTWKLYRNSSNTNTGNKDFMFYVVGTITN